jgi:hypothetical protein
MKFNFKILIATIVLVNVCCISSNLIYYKDSSYFDKPNKMNKLYLFPITSVKFDRASKDFTEFHLLRDPLTIEETFLDHFNNEYMRMARNNLNKSAANSESASACNHPVHYTAIHLTVETS